MIEVYRPKGCSGNCLVTIAIGGNYKPEWETNALPGWQKYCDRHDLGLYVVTGDLITKDHPKWKKPTWQKLLLGHAMKAECDDVENVCYLDTDILIGPTAPNIFDYYDGRSYGLVSKITGLPMPLDTVLRRFVFLRHKFYDSTYPLDSVVFMPVREQYEYSGLPPFDEGACAGLFLFNVERCADEMQFWFHKYDVDTPSITGGDQIHLNWEMLNSGQVQWLPYEFQALWVYEMAWKYPFLYTIHKSNKTLIRECIEASLFSNYFLHFAGSWYESDMWRVGDIMVNPNVIETHADFERYLKRQLTGQPKGLIKPTKTKISSD